MTEPGRYEFGDVRVDLRRMIVTVRGEPVALEPKSFDVLRYLIEHRDRLVGKDDLLNAVWGDTFVTPNVLTRAVAQLRRAIGDDAHNARYIETVSRRGYRFLAPVTEGPADDGATAEVPPVAVPVPPPMTRGPGRRKWPARRPARRRRPGPRRRRVVGRRAARRSASAPAARVRPAAPGDHAQRREHLARAVARRADGGLRLGPHRAASRSTSPAWPPGAREIADHQRRDAEHPARLVARRPMDRVPLARAPRRLDRARAPAARRGRWSSSDPTPPGRRTGSTSSSPPTPEGMAAQSVLWSVRRDGTERKELTRIGQPPGGHREPAWSARRTQRRLRGLARAGGDRRSGRCPPPAARRAGWRRRSSGGLSPQFTPDGRAHLLGVAVHREHRGLALAPGPGPVHRAVPSVAAAEVLDVGGVLEGLSVARDGSIAYGVTTADMNLWAVDVRPDGSPAEPVRLTHDVVRSTIPTTPPTAASRSRSSVRDAPSSAWLMNDDGTNAEPLLAETPVGAPAVGPRREDPRQEGDARAGVVLVAGSAHAAADPGPGVSESRHQQRAPVPGRPRAGLPRHRAPRGW